ncbi:MAG: UDP-glucose 4-epimerase GalE [SAR86 cluster bacterium]|nr:UDP-glucose 4-epimerase GalE [SAR86 cluster bacterium]
MKFFIPGGAGYIGAHISYMLLESGHDVVILDNFSNSSISSVNSIENLAGKKVTLYEGDIRNDELLFKIFNAHSFDGVIHLAALKSVSESINKPSLYHENNVEGTMCLLATMRSFDMKNLIFSSSATVYGLPQYLPIDECHPLSSINPYAQTKLDIEKELETLAANEDDWKIVSLRYFNPVGAHESGMIGESPLDTPNNIMPYIVNVANKELPYIEIFGNDYDTKDGTGVRDYIHVMDLAESHLIALNFIGIKVFEHKLNQTAEDNYGFNVFNIGTGKGQSVLELINTFQKVNDIEVPYKFTSRRPGDVSSCYADVDKSFKAFQWVARRTIEEMCISAWNFKNQNYG